MITFVLIFRYMVLLVRCQAVGTVGALLMPLFGVAHHCEELWPAPLLHSTVMKLEADQGCVGQLNLNFQVGWRGVQLWHVVLNVR